MIRYFAFIAAGALFSACSGAGPIEPGNPGQAGAGGAPDAGSTCDRNDPNKDYKANSPEQCMRVKFACPEGSSYFSNDCGCGCEKTPRQCEQVQCLRAIECVESCGGPVLSSGCCPCAPPAFDSIRCEK